MKLFELFGVLNVDDKQFNQKIQQANIKGKSLSNILTKGFAGTAKTVGGLMVGMVGSIIGGSVMLGKKLKEMGQQYNSGMEMYMSNFETLLGSPEKALKKLEFLKEYARKTPFELPQLAEAQKTLLAFNVDAEESEKILKNIGDISLGDSNKMNSLALAFGQMSSTGRLMGQDLNQMINAGFNPLTYIAKKTGKSVAELKDEMSKGKISVEMVTQAFADATAEGGQFYKGLEKGSQIFAGQMSTLQDNVKELAGKITSGTMEWVKNLIPEAQKAIQELTKAFEERGFDGLLDAAFNIFNRIGKEISKEAKNYAKTIGNFITKIMHNVSSNIGQTISTGIDILEGILDGIINALPKFIPAFVEGMVVFLSNILNRLPSLLGKVVQGLAEGLVSVFSLALRRMSGITAETDKEIEAIRNKYQALQQDVENTSTAFNNKIENIINKQQVIQQILSRMQELNSKDVLTEDEKLELQGLVAQIKEIDDVNFDWTFNAETGKLEAPKKTVEEYTQAYNDYMTTRLAFLKEMKEKGKTRTDEDNAKTKKVIDEINAMLGQTVIKWNENSNTFTVVNGSLEKMGKIVEKEVSLLAKYQQEYDALNKKNEDGGALTDKEKKRQEELATLIETQIGKISTATGAGKQSFEEYTKAISDNSKELAKNAIAEALAEAQKANARRQLELTQEKKQLKKEWNKNQKTGAGYQEGIANSKAIINAFMGIAEKYQMGKITLEEVKKEQDEWLKSNKTLIDSIQTLIDKDPTISKETKEKLNQDYENENYMSYFVGVNELFNNGLVNLNATMATQEATLKGYDETLKLTAENNISLQETAKAMLNELGIDTPTKNNNTDGKETKENTKNKEENTTATRRQTKQTEDLTNSGKQLEQQNDKVSNSAGRASSENDKSANSANKASVANDKAANSAKAFADKIPKDDIFATAKTAISDFVSAVLVEIKKLNGTPSPKPPRPPKPGESTYAQGGIFNQPTFFPHANAIVGEAGPEAVIPLRDFYTRLENGLGKNAGKGNTIVINQTFTGSKTDPRETARQTRLAIDRLQYGGNI